jgi:hypothetical protein
VESNEAMALVKQQQNVKQMLLARKINDEKVYINRLKQRMHDSKVRDGTHDEEISNQGSPERNQEPRRSTGGVDMSQDGRLKIKDLMQT